MSATPETDLRHVSTRWSQMDDLDTFVLRYIAPIREYLGRLVEADIADDLLQTLLVRLLDRGLDNVSRDRGRFRHYLIRVVRNEVATWHREQSRSRLTGLGERVVADDASDPAALVADDWNRSWRQAILSRARTAVQAHEERTDGCLFATILARQQSAGDQRSDEIAAAVAAESGVPLSAANYRQQLSRARRMLADAVRREVAETLDDPTPAAIDEELAELGLLRAVGPLRASRRSRPRS